MDALNAGAVPKAGYLLKITGSQTSGNIWVPGGKEKA